MTELCDQVHAFFDGELERDEAMQFHEHLAGCEACRGKLEELRHLAALQNALDQETLDETKAADGGSVVPLKPRIQRLVLAGAVVAAAAALILAHRTWPDGGGASGMRLDGGVPAGEALAAEFAEMLGSTRKIEGRLSYVPADVHRRYSVMRAGDGKVEPEGISPGLIGSLEDDGEHRGVVAAHLLNLSYGLAEKYLDSIPESPDALSDRAVLLLQSREQRNIERAVLLLDQALEAEPDHPQALWNRGLALEALDFEFQAASAFEAVANLGEQGWSEEARTRAETLKRRYAERENVWVDLEKRGGAMVRREGVLSSEDADARPGLTRHYVYEAIRTAPDVTRVEELRLLAEAVDRRLGTEVLGRLIDRAASSDFAVRGPLAAQYLELWGGADASPEQKTRFLERLRASGQYDILLGALRYSTKEYRQSREYFDEYRRLAKELGDPWFTVVAIEQEARLRMDQGRPDMAIEPLRAAVEKFCDKRTSLDYRCVGLEYWLAMAYLEAHRPNLASDVARKGWKRALGVGQHYYVLRFPPLRAQLLHLRNDVNGQWLPLVRDYLAERHPSAVTCVYQFSLHAMRAQMLINDNRFGEAREEMERARALVGGELCPSGKPAMNLERATVLAHLLRPRDEGSATDVAALRHDLQGLREEHAEQPGELAYIDYLEGRLLIERDPHAGERLLRRAINSADRVINSDNGRRVKVAAEKARAYSYSVLIQSAGQRGEHADALSLLAEEVRMPPPERCALGLAREESLVIVVRGVDGALKAKFRPLKPRENLSDDWRVPEDIAAAVAGCEQVDVYARAPFFGRAMLLPDETAWRFHTGRSSRSSAPPATPSILIVANVKPPEEADVSPLRSYKPDKIARNERWIEDAQATPRRVLAAMVTATEVEIRAHGRGDFGVNYLILSPDPNGEYRLTADRIRENPLRGAPVVVLSACRVGESAQYFHDPWSLASAFLHAGARAVFASPEPVADSSSDEFFAAIRRAVRGGTAPAAALRDQRLARKASSEEDAWVRSVVVFQ